MALQPCVRLSGLGLFHGFLTVDFSRVGSLTPRPTTNLKDQGLYFIQCLPLSMLLFDLGGTARGLRSRQHSSLGQENTLHSKAVRTRSVG
jgi:hypothetical protein